MALTGSDSSSGKCGHTLSHWDFPSLICFLRVVCRGSRPPLGQVPVAGARPLCPVPAWSTGVVDLRPLLIRPRSRDAARVCGHCRLQGGFQNQEKWTANSTRHVVSAAVNIPYLKSIEGVESFLLSVSSSRNRSQAFCSSTRASVLSRHLFPVPLFLLHCPTCPQL